MRPDFSETQLQQLVNIVIIDYFAHTTRTRLAPIIPSLPEEELLGWDTGFYFPFLAIPMNPDHKGCNIFIQYKISDFLIGKEAPEWIYWNEPFFRFQIPHEKLNEEGRYYYDYHQFDRLKELASHQNQYPVYYATNQVCHLSELLRSYSDGSLFDNTPCLKIAGTDNNHVMASFTKDSPHFLLSSKPSKINKSKMIDLIKDTDKSKATNLFDDFKILVELIHAIEEHLKINKEKGFIGEMKMIQQFPEQLKVYWKYLLIRKYLRLYLNLNWLKIWAHE